MRHKKGAHMKQYALFSYTAGCSAVFFVVLLMVLALTLSPRPQEGGQQQVAQDGAAYHGSSNTVGQYVWIPVPVTVPQEVYIEN